MSVGCPCFCEDKVAPHTLLSWFVLLFINHYNYLTNCNIEKLSTEWEATKKLGDSIEFGQAEEVLIDMEMNNPTCPLDCELSLRWGLPCQHWIYPAFIHQVPFPVSLIHPRWFLDGPPRLETPWKIGFSPTHDVARAQSAIPEPEDHFQRLRNIEDLKNARYSGDQ